MKKRFNSNLLKKWSGKIAAIAVIFFWGLIASLGLLQKFDFRLYDLLLGIRKDPEIRPEILFVEIDNKSLDEIGAWPWSRDVLANSLLRMKELGAATAVFDIEYLSPSNLGVNPSATAEISQAIDSQKKDLSDVINQLAGAPSSGMYSVRDLPELARTAVNDWVNPGLDALKENINQSAYQDNDKIFARALQFFGNSWLTINNMDLEINYTPEYIKYVKDKTLFRNVVDNGGRIARGNSYYLQDQGGTNRLGFCPAREQFMRCAKGAGFTNVVIDSDGTRRRVELLSDQTGYYAAQLVFAPILRMLNPESIVRAPFSLKLVNATDPDTGKKINMTIPLDIHGRMVINWLHREFADSFRHESVIMMYQLDETEANIISLLETINGFNLWDKNGQPLPYKDEVEGILSDYNGIKLYKNFLLEKCNGYDENGEAVDGGISDSEYTDYFALRQEFYDRVSSFIDGSYFQEIYDRLDEMNGNKELANADEVKGDVSKLYDQLKWEDENFRSTFNEKKDVYKGSFCIIGNTASSTTDLGTTPFNRSYPNVGTHANVYNSIMTRSFVREVDWIAGFIIAAFLALFAVIASEGKPVWVQNVLGILSVVISVLVPIFLMILFRIYVPITAPVLITVITYLVVVILRFVTAEQDKGVLRNAFSTYLAPAVVEQIMKDPSMLKLGGDEKRITALFSDIKAFSSFSELVTPAKLVSVLNGYLGNMSDQILAQQGTIDKYIGDSIVSFFGAPIDLENSAWNACVAAIRMKQEEEKYNKENIERGVIPRELHTRIGINTGDMVVGNMGTSVKMNYTIMGDAVNLASRLEGVNKYYKSWILCSDATWQEANSGEHFGKIVARRFDRVRVFGRDEPVQLWNILGFENELDADVIKAADVYNDAMNAYLNKDYLKAGKLFIEANKLVPSDETPLVFAKRCKDFVEKGVPEKWDGILNMTSK